MLTQIIYFRKYKKNKSLKENISNNYSGIQINYKNNPFRNIHYSKILRDQMRFFVLADAENTRGIVTFLIV